MDTFENSLVSFFKLKGDDYLTLGADIALAGLPMLFVMERSCDIEEIGFNTVNTLISFKNSVGKTIS